MLYSHAVEQRGNRRSFGNKVAQKAQMLSWQLGQKQADAGDVAAWSIHTGHEANADWIDASLEDDRDR